MSSAEYDVSIEPAKQVLCGYNSVHSLKGVAATTQIDCGVVGIVPACNKCADFYAGL